MRPVVSSRFTPKPQSRLNADLEGSQANGVYAWRLPETTHKTKEPGGQWTHAPNRKPTHRGPINRALLIGPY